jgi:hypothetical protein
LLRLLLKYQRPDHPIHDDYPSLDNFTGVSLPAVSVREAGTFIRRRGIECGRRGAITIGCVSGVAIFGATVFVVALTILFLLIS